MLQVWPVQQSPVVVQAPPAGTQVVPPSGGGRRQRSTPWPSGTQGAPPQHSEENLHWSPPAMQHGALPVYPFGHVGVEPPKQRGIPSESALQHCHFGGWQSQQSSRALPHWLVPFLIPHSPPRG
jgi:hypothetical protein